MGKETFFFFLKEVTVKVSTACRMNVGEDGCLTVLVRLLSSSGPVSAVMGTTDGLCSLNS